MGVALPVGLRLVGYLLFFLTVCVYVVLGFFFTVLLLTNLPVLALLLTLAIAVTFQLASVRRATQ